MGGKMSKLLVPVLPFFEYANTGVPVRVVVDSKAVSAENGMPTRDSEIAVFEVLDAAAIVTILKQYENVTPVDMEHSPDTWVSTSVIDSGEIHTITLTIENASDELLNEVAGTMGVELNVHDENETAPVVVEPVSDLVDDVLVSEPTVSDQTVSPETNETIDDKFVDELTF